MGEIKKIKGFAGIETLTEVHSHGLYLRDASVGKLTIGQSLYNVRVTAIMRNGKKVKTAIIARKGEGAFTLELKKNIVGSLETAINIIEFQIPIESVKPIPKIQGDSIVIHWESRMPLVGKAKYEF